jgi:hypothetical protein
MLINADFTKRAIVHAARMSWVPSPLPGVERRMLDRIGDEVARATSVVRYLPGSVFAPHTHDGGEEFLVLEGTFQDEHGDFPSGSYVRNPPTSRHTPRSGPGCVILVKLHQFDPNDRTLVRLDVNKMESLADAGRPGVAVVPLFKDSHETVRIETLAPHTAFELRGVRAVRGPPRSRRDVRGAILAQAAAGRSRASRRRSRRRAHLDEVRASRTP